MNGYIDLHQHEQHATEIWRPWIMPDGMRWYGGPGELQGKAGGDICHIDGPWWGHIEELECPYGAPGDVLACREEWASYYCDESDGDLLTGDVAFYRDTCDCDPSEVEWRPASEMPDWAIRRRVTVRQVEVRRVSTITEAEAMAAGWKGLRHLPDVGGWLDPPTFEMRRWWDSAFPATPWASDPWCWRVVVENLNKE